MRDVFAEILAAVRLRSCIYCQSDISRTNWGLRFNRIAGAAFHILAEGCCWIEIEGSEQSLHLSPGDLIVLPGGHSHQVVDQPGAVLCADIQLDQQVGNGCVHMSWGDSGPRTRLVCGTFNIDQDQRFFGATLLPMLPTLLHFDRQATQRFGIKPSMDALLEEANHAQPGRETVLTRLADVLFVKVIRAWLAEPSNQTKGVLRALNDPYLSLVLSRIHEAPEQQWTVEQLAAQASMSRSAFAAHFAEVIGETPFQYVTRWRMQVAADLLKNTPLSIPDVAARVGYQSDLTFSKAFRRQMDTSPARYRRAARTADKGQTN